MSGIMRSTAARPSAIASLARWYSIAPKFGSSGVISTSAGSPARRLRATRCSTMSSAVLNTSKIDGTAGSPPFQVRSIRRTTWVHSSPVTQDSSWSSSPEAYTAPTSAPIEVPQMRSGFTPCSSRARIAPMCAQPRALPAPSARPMRGLRLRPSNPLEDRGDTLPAADAHGDQRVALLRALELVERLHRQDRAGGADRMAERDRAAVRVDLRRVEAEVLGHRHRLHGERLVRLDDVHVGRLEPGLFEHPLHRRYGPQAHELRLKARVRIGDEPRQRLGAGVLRRLRLHQHDRRRGIIEARRVAGRDRAVLLEHGLELRHVRHARFLAHMLVGGELLHAFARLELDRNDLAVEVLAVHRLGGAAMRIHAVLVLLLAREAAFGGDVLGGATPVARAHSC